MQKNFPSSLYFLAGVLLGIVISVQSNICLHTLRPTETATSTRLDAEAIILDPSSELKDGANTLTNVYTDMEHGFSLHYPASFLERTFSNWRGIVDNDAKAQIWIGFCSPGCDHFVRTPSARLLDEYKKDYVVTWRESGDIPMGEERHIHIVESREFTTSNGVPALEQYYTTTGFDAATGKEVILYCAEDTPCTGTEPPTLRYVFFSGKKEPYILVTKNLLPIVQNIVDTVSY